jgi:hypothetical protein
VACCARAAADGVPVLRISALKQTIRGSAPDEYSTGTAQAVLAGDKLFFLSGQSCGWRTTAMPGPGILCALFRANRVCISLLHLLLYRSCHSVNLRCTLPPTKNLFDFERPRFRGGLVVHRQRLDWMRSG